MLSMENGKKASILLILKVLQEYSDEDHYLTYEDISNKIKDVYKMKIERKSIGTSIQLLEDLGYDIVKKKKKGVALYSRIFDETEASYLIDAIFSSKSISAKHAKGMSDAISSTFSVYKRKNYSYIYKSKEIIRTSNQDVLFNISILHEAIKKNKKASFQYYGYDNTGKKNLRMNGYTYYVSPYYLINNYGNYYLLCHYRDKYGPISVYRIDYMTNIQLMDDDLVKLEDIDPTYKNFSITKYLNEHIYIFGGKVVEATLEILSENSIIYVKDWFGEQVKIFNKDKKTYALIKTNENALCYWLMQYSKHIKVISPQCLVNRIKSELRSALELYEY